MNSMAQAATWTAIGKTAAILAIIMTIIVLIALTVVMRRAEAHRRRMMDEWDRNHRTIRRARDEGRGGER